MSVLNSQGLYQRNVLLITHAFPPGGTVEVQRVTKFAEYLPDFGWDPYVLTADRDSEDSKRGSLESPDTVKTVRRSSFIGNHVPLARDEGLRWIPSVASNAVSMIDTYEIDVVFHTAPVFLPFAAIEWIKRRTGIPYVIDLRDPWTIHPRDDENSLKAQVYNRLSSRLEPYVFRTADGIVMNSARMEELYATKYPEQCEKFQTIYNGFDSRDLEGLQPRPADEFQIIYPGRFRNDMRTFFEAFDQFVQQHPDSKFVHYGARDRGYAPEVRAVVDDLDLHHHVEFRGYADYETVLETMLGSDLGIAVTRDGDDTHVPAKIYDYIACNIPVLCIDDAAGAARALLSEFDHGYVVARDKPNAIYDILNSIRKDNIEQIGESHSRRKYTRKIQAEILSEILTDIAEGVS